SHSATLEHQLGRAPGVTGEESSEIPPGFLSIGIDVAKNNTAGFDLVVLSPIGSSKGGNFCLALSKLLRGDKRRKPAIGQACDAPQRCITPTTHPDVDFLSWAGVDRDMLEAVVLPMVAHVRPGPELAQNSNAFIGHGTPLFEWHVECL